MSRLSRPVGRAVRRTVNRVGYDVVRQGSASRSSNPAAAPPALAKAPSAESRFSERARHEWTRVAAMIDRLGATVVVDVGANQGQYARGLRLCGYSGAIDSYEPVLAAYEVAARHAETDPLWKVHRLALGRSDATASINVAANSAQSSSLLPMLERHKTAAPHATYVGTEDVPVRRLDDAVADASGERVFLKIDTQGYELEVLAGARHLLADSVCAVQVELSLVPLYDRGPTYLDVVKALGRLGFRLAHVLPGYSDPANDEMLQFDGIFVRTDGG